MASKRRFGMQEDDARALCDQMFETVGHLTASCIFTRQVWQLMLTLVGLLALMLEYEDELEEWWLRQRA